MPESKFPVGSWVLRYYPPVAQKKLGSPWVGPQQVVRQATGHTVGIQKGPDAPNIFIQVDDLKMCPAPRETQWTPGPPTAKSLCASMVAFRPGSHVSESDSSPSVMVSTWKDLSSIPNNSEIRLNLDNPIDLTGHFHYQSCRFHSIAHLMCFRYAVINDLKLFATSVRKWSRHLTDFPIDRFNTHNWQVQCRSVLKDIYSHLCLTDVAVREALVDTGPQPFVLKCHTPQGGLCDIINNVLIEARVDLAARRLASVEWLQPAATCGGLRNANR